MGKKPDNKWSRRNGGKDCESKDAKRFSNCNDGCCPKDCVWNEWGTWSACPEILTSEQQYERAHRSILVEHECSERGGRSCEGDSEKSRECNILDIKNKIIAEKEKEIDSLEDEIKGLKEGCNVNEGAVEPYTELGKGSCSYGKGYFSSIIDHKFLNPNNKEICYQKCKSTSGCTAFQFSRNKKASHCFNYRKGPYTKVKGNDWAICYKMN